MKPSRLPHILIFEPRIGGHHLSWLRYLCEDFSANGFPLTMAVDLRPKTADMIRRQFEAFQDTIPMLSAYDAKGRYLAGSKTAALNACFNMSQADEILMPNFDEVAAHWLRMAFLGKFPPPALRGRLNGVYFRPRFLAAQRLSPGNFIKKAGFHRLSRGGWFKNLYLLDEYLTERARKEYGNIRFHFLPDPWSGDFSHDKGMARQELDVPADRFVFLHYGLGTRRKGLHLEIEAMQRPSPEKIFLLCAGEIDKDRRLLDGVRKLEKAGRARVINRYVSAAEEELCFVAADVVLLPYVQHFGSSGVLSRAAAAGKPVIASDEGLLARRVQKHGLGLLFKSEKHSALHLAMVQAANMDIANQDRYRQAALQYARTCTRDAFGSVLINSFTI